MPARTIEREQFLADIITGAIEGGTGYWACVHAYKWQKTDGTDLPPAGVYAVIQVDDEEHDAALREGIANYINNEGHKPNVLVLAGYGLTIDDEPLLHKLDIDMIARGIAVVKANEDICNSRLRRDILVGDNDNDAGMIDADCADVIVQAALFDKLVYG